MQLQNYKKNRHYALINFLFKKTQAIVKALEVNTTINSLYANEFSSHYIPAFVRYSMGVRPVRFLKKTGK